MTKQFHFGDKVMWSKEKAIFLQYVKRTNWFKGIKDSYDEIAEILLTALYPCTGYILYIVPVNELREGWKK